jgi:putative glutamine amidotransferase
MQLLAVACGGALRHGVDHVRPGSGHPVRTAPGSTVRGLLGPEACTSALHHQAVAHPGADLRATAWADDGTIEALEPIDPRWQVLGVQWHPELTGHPSIRDDQTGPALFGWVVAAARGPVAVTATPAKGAWFCR